MVPVNGRRRWCSERGAELIEFALVLPLLLLILLGIGDFGLLFHHYEVVTNAAREGARVAVLPIYSNDAEADSTVRARVTAYLNAGGLIGTAITSRLPPVPTNVGGVCIMITGATVAYDHDFLFMDFILQVFGGPSLTSRTLTATSMMRYEGAATGC